MHNQNMISSFSYNPYFKCTIYLMHEFMLFTSHSLFCLFVYILSVTVSLYFTKSFFDTTNLLLKSINNRIR